MRTLHLIGIDKNNTLLGIDKNITFHRIDKKSTLQFKIFILASKLRHIAETNLRSVRSSGICMLHPNSPSLIVSEILAFNRTDNRRDG